MCSEVAHTAQPLPDDTLTKTNPTDKSDEIEQADPRPQRECAVRAQRDRDSPSRICLLQEGPASNSRATVGELEGVGRVKISCENPQFDIRDDFFRVKISCENILRTAPRSLLLRFYLLCFFVSSRTLTCHAAV